MNTSTPAAIGVATASRTVLSVTWPRGFVGPVSRRQVRPEHEDDDRRHDHAQEQPEQRHVARIVARVTVWAAVCRAHTTWRKPPM